MNPGLMYHLLKIWRNQWSTKQELEELQQRKLQRILRHAYNRVGYYRQLFDSVGIRPEDIRNTNDLRYIPVTSRRRIQSLPTKEIIAQGVKLRNCHHMRTSGSTGIPLELIKTEKEYQFSNLVMMRSLLANGYRLTHKQVIVTSSVIMPTYWFQYLGIMRRKFISAFDSLDNQVEQMRQVRPHFILGYPSSLRRIAEEVRRRDREDISPRTIVTGAEILDPKTRQIIQSAFRSKVADFYSCRECGNIAWECDRHEGYHINIDSFVVEIVNNGKSVRPGEKGEVFITSLDSYAMPFIRYRIQDIGIAKEELCSCGRGLPLLERIEGRTDDQVVLSDGSIISPFEFNCALCNIPGISQFRVIQKNIDDFIVQLKIDPNFTQKAVIKKTHRKMTSILSHQANVEIRILDDIPRDRSGKSRSTISNIEPSISNNL